MVDYPPLNFIKHLPMDFNAIKRLMLNVGCRNIDKITISEYLDFMLSDNFLNPYSTSKYKDINLVLFDSIRVLKETLKDSFDNICVDAELRDNFVMPVVVNEWAKYKQVYKPDSDFAKALFSTNNLEISRSMVEHLPCKLFYIDTMDCDDFGNINGIFTYVHHNYNSVEFVVYLITENEAFFSFYIGGQFNDKGIIKLDYDQINSETQEFFLEQGENDTELIVTNKQMINANVSRKIASLFALQMVAYLSIEKPQITESDLTKHTYKPTSSVSKIRNKWSEVKIDDVGIKYGSTYRKQMAEIKSNPSYSIGKRKSPIPHFRCAHWHKYWVGEGRTELRVNWIAPTFVGNSEPKMVTIHKVEK